MSILLRHPATVPALFSRAVEADRATDGAASGWHRLISGPSLPGAVAWVALVLVEVPLVKATATLLGLDLPL